MRHVTIIGGGLAGLGLGIALRRQSVPVTVHEAGHYPRHRVCGEFITSLDAGTRNVLQLDEYLRAARQAAGVSWCEDGKADIVHQLPRPALCLSRHSLDHAMAKDFVELGGELRTGSRVPCKDEAGYVDACGRKPDPRSAWVGIKRHYRDLALRNDLEVHFGRGGYIGLTKVDDETANVCGLLRRDAADFTADFPEIVRQSGLRELAARLEKAEPVENSFCSVAGLNYRARVEEDGPLRIGDRHSLVPPYTGHGMTMALQSAATVLTPLLSWARGDSGWPEARNAAMLMQRKRFDRRLHMARVVHPLILDRRTRRWARGFHRVSLLPVRLLYRMTH